MKYFLSGLLFIFSLSSHAIASEQYPFPEDAQKQQFQRLLKELRCLVCQNQDLADSNSNLANDLKKIVYQKVQANESDQEIKNFLVTRYGDFVLFNPPLKKQTYALWFMPFLLLVFGLGLLFYVVRKMKASHG